MPPWQDSIGREAPRRALFIMATLLIGVAGALVYARTPLPLPWFLGPMLACLLAVAVRVPVQVPDFMTLVMRIVLGLAIGSAFSPEMASRAGEMLVSLSFVIPYVIVLGLLGYPYFRLFPGYNRVTAFLAAMPGGLQTMMSIAEDSGGDLRRLSIVHSTRVLVIVFLLPLWIQFMGSLDMDRIVPPAASLAAIGAEEAILLVACGVAGYFAAAWAGVSGAAIIGPMLANGALHMAGIAEARVPVELVNAAQLVIGVHIGCQFVGVTVRELSSTVAIAIGYALILILGAALFAALVVWATGIGANAVVLAYAPGGQPEMNLVALVLDIDPAYVALHHLLRVMVIVLGAQFVIAWLVRRHARAAGTRAR